MSKPTQANQATELKVQIRWLIKRDMPEVLEIERQSSPTPWAEENFLTALRTRNCIGMVAEFGNEIVGFIVYELHKNSLSLLNLAVHPDYRHRTVGSQMIRRMVDKLSQQRRTQLDIILREGNLDGQLFLKSHDFRCVHVLRDYYEATQLAPTEDGEEATIIPSEDGYHFQYRMRAVDDVFSPFSPQNRISQYYED